MEYAVIKSGGKQYKVHPGDILEVDKIPGSVDGEVKLSEILLFVADGEIQIGTPFLSNISIKGKILEQKKGEKIHVRKFKAKARYRRNIGFRPLLTRVQIEKIESKKSAGTNKRDITIVEKTKKELKRKQ